MFFSLSKIITFLLDPLFYIFLVLIIAILGSRYSKKLKGILLLFFIISATSTTDFVANKAIGFLENLQQSSNLKPHYDAVIVLAGMLDLTLSTRQNLEFSGAIDRILKGIELVKNETASYLLISGGDGGLNPSGKSEADLLAIFAMMSGVPEDKIIIESHSRNTFENALETNKIVQNYQFEELLLVTSAFHMHRSMGCFKNQNLNPDILMVDFHKVKDASIDFRNFIPSSRGLSKLSIFIHESIGIIAYYLTGKATWK